MAAGLPRGRPTQLRTGGIASTTWSNSVMSFRFAAVSVAPERNPLAVSENMMLRPRLAVIGRVRSRSFPARSARSEALSTIARARSSRPRRHSSASKTACRRVQTPLPVHQPAPTGDAGPAAHLSWEHLPGNATAEDERNTGQHAPARNRLPAWRRFRARRLGRIGSTRFHNSSSSSGSVMPDHLLVGRATVPSLGSKDKRPVV